MRVRMRMSGQTAPIRHTHIAQHCAHHHCHDCDALHTIRSGLGQFEWNGWQQMRWGGTSVPEKVKVRTEPFLTAVVRSLGYALSGSTVQAPFKVTLASVCVT